MSERHIPAELRRLVADRGQHCCEYCRTQARYSADSFTVDHIIPRNLGGSTTADNLALCCHGCNQHKSRRAVVADPVTATLVRLFHRREQRWGAHFAWNDDFTRMLGLTSTGRATIAALQTEPSRTGEFASCALCDWRTSTQAECRIVGSAVDLQTVYMSTPPGTLSTRTCTHSHAQPRRLAMRLSGGGPIGLSWRRCCMATTASPSCSKWSRTGVSTTSWP